MKKNIQQLVKWAKSIDYAEVYSASKSAEIEEYAQQMKAQGYPWSGEFTDFFLLTNGFFYNGIYIFSLHSNETAEHLDLSAQNQQWGIADRLPGCILFGRSDEEVYVYNQPENKFQVLDLTGWDEYYAFETMADLFEFVMVERI